MPFIPYGRRNEFFIDDGQGIVETAVDGKMPVVGADCTLGIRPEHFVLSDKGSISGTVVATEMLGAETIIFALLQSGENVTVAVPGIRSLPPGASVRFSVDRRFVHVFDRNGITLPPLRSWREDYIDT